MTPKKIFQILVNKNAIRHKKGVLLWNVLLLSLTPYTKFWVKKNHPINLFPPGFLTGVHPWRNATLQQDRHFVGKGEKVQK